LTLNINYEYKHYTKTFKLILKSWAYIITVNYKLTQYIKT